MNELFEINIFAVIFLLVIIGLMTNYILFGITLSAVVLTVPWIFISYSLDLQWYWYLFPIGLSLASVLVFWAGPVLTFHLIFELAFRNKLSSLLRTIIPYAIVSYVYSRGEMIGIFISSLFWHIVSSILISIFVAAVLSEHITGGKLALIFFVVLIFLLVVGYSTNVRVFTLLVMDLMKKK
ncbi:MAG: hypothetical protein NZ927_00305 [Candidatus Calescibacterium sp.]|nr:hypothetical protein [Candidatus Calescibacterium sp.]MCX7733812.1 hypothetical protein [bacterium]MDW8086982.1 hypothetical protein [Candidatus Calescibacterium sp.]